MKNKDPEFNNLKIIYKENIELTTLKISEYFWNTNDENLSLFFPVAEFLEKVQILNIPLY